MNSVPPLLETKDFSNLEKWLSMEKKHTIALLGELRTMVREGT